MKKTIVATENAPAAVGPYSQAVAGGGLLFCSGQIPLDPETGELVGGSIGDQTRRCMQNLEAVLEAGGSSLEAVVKTTVFLTNIDDYAEFNEAYAGFIGADPPARAAFAVSALPRGAAVEIECIAQL
ncbi:MAG: 2-iminobutanoate/2-iminopropanoate deaminase [Actinomycetota bacterium]|jgi:2-iminobutanoate/2-iminopropanoate deaminase|nr:2-iminobutanoate/2-iminopropanoate deaminase [Actinomycetota bacterium]